MNLLKCYLAALSMSGILIATPVTPEMKSNALKAITNCHASYQMVQVSSGRLAKIRKPAKSAPELDKLIYKNKKISKKAFENNFHEFKMFFTIESKKISEATTAEALGGLVPEYLSNCSRFSQGLLNFVDWATTGAGQKLYGRIYNEWLDEARCKKNECS